MKYIQLVIFLAVDIVLAGALFLALGAHNAATNTAKAKANPTPTVVPTATTVPVPTPLPTAILGGVRLDQKPFTAPQANTLDGAALWERLNVQPGADFVIVYPGDGSTGALAQMVANKLHDTQTFATTTTIPVYSGDSVFASTPVRGGVMIVVYYAA